MQALVGSVLVHRVVLQELVHQGGVLLVSGGQILVQRVVLLARVHRVVSLALGNSVLVHGVFYLALMG